MEYYWWSTLEGLLVTSLIDGALHHWRIHGTLSLACWCNILPWEKCFAHLWTFIPFFNGDGWVLRILHILRPCIMDSFPWFNEDVHPLDPSHILSLVSWLGTCLMRRMTSTLEDFSLHILLCHCWGHPQLRVYWLHSLWPWMERSTYWGQSHMVQVQIRVQQWQNSIWIWLSWWDLNKILH